MKNKEKKVQPFCVIVIPHMFTVTNLGMTVIIHTLDNHTSHRSRQTSTETKLRKVQIELNTLILTQNMRYNTFVIFIKNIYKALRQYMNYDSANT